jgi:hypothetical protein
MLTNKGNFIFSILSPKDPRLKFVYHNDFSKKDLSRDELS